MRSAAHGMPGCTGDFLMEPVRDYSPSTVATFFLIQEFFLVQRSEVHDRAGGRDGNRTGNRSRPVRGKNYAR
jgi:hypothetical protein